MISGPVLTGTSHSGVAEEEGATLTGADPAVSQPASIKKSGSRLQKFMSSIKGEKETESRGQTDDDVTTQLLEVKQHTERRKTATVNLGKQKINKLTGHGNIKRKPIGDTEPVRAPKSQHGQFSAIFPGLEEAETEEGAQPLSPSSLAVRRILEISAQLPWGQGSWSLQRRQVEAAGYRGDARGGLLPVSRG